MRCGIVATDFSKASENAFQYALAFADRNGPLKLVVSHVFREASHGLLTEKQLAQYKGQEKHKSMEQVKRFSSVAPDLTSEDAVMRHQIEVISEQGSPSQVIIELADKKMAECIVIGAKRSPGLLKRLFGQVSQHQPGLLQTC